MSEFGEQNFARTAIALGFLAPDVLDREREALVRSGAPRSLAEWLQERGCLTRAQAESVLQSMAAASARATIAEPAAGGVPATARLEETIVAGPAAAAEAARQATVGVARGSEPGGTSTGLGRASVPAAAGPAGTAVGQLGKYQLLEELGRGGMGVVYRAWDGELRREVALKTALLGDRGNAERVERLLREARTAATLDHPGIVPIHDMGAVDGVPYFAMAYLRGRTLDQALRAGAFPELRDRALVVLQVAQAVAHAHDRQVVHRDLKPSNVLIDEAGRAHVMDFGLAKRLDEAQGLTASGQMLGTPQYMPPEQIDGELSRIGPHSDVYALGAVLYEALTGHPPFEGATMAEIVARALNRDPVKLRVVDRRIPADLETICLKALEKEPLRRYRNAGEMAEELDRYRRGEAIQARPASWATVTLRRVSRHRGLAAAGILALLAVGWGIVAAAGRAELQDKVRKELRDKASLYLDAALSLRRAGLPMAKAEQDYLPKLEAAVRDAEEAEPDRAEPRYHLGRLYRALLRFEEARMAQEAALAHDPEFAPSRYERVILLLRRYHGRVDELRSRALAEAGLRFGSGPGGDDPGTRRPALPADEALVAADAEAPKLLADAAADLAAIEAKGATSGVANAQMACAKGWLLALRSGSAVDRERARLSLQEAVSGDPSLEEGYEALASLEGAHDRLEAAIEACSRGIAVDVGYVPLWMRRALLRLRLASRRHAAGKEVGKLYEEAAADDRKVIELAPTSPEGPYHLALVLLQWGNRELGSGIDPGPRYRAAAQAVETAMAREGAPAKLWAVRAMARTNQGTWEKGNGRDPVSLYEGALGDHAKAIALEPGHARHFLHRGQLYMNWGRYDVARGEDPSERYARAEQDFTAALERDSLAAESWFARGMLHTNRGLAEITRKEDAVPRFAAAIADLGRAIELDRRYAVAWKVRGMAQQNWAAVLMNSGEDAGSHLRAAAEDLRTAVGLDPASATAMSALGGVELNQAMNAQGRGEDPGPHYRSAEETYTKALALDPGSYAAWCERGSVRRAWATWQSGKGQEAETTFAAADADFGKALELRAHGSEARSSRTLLRMEWGAHRVKNGGDVEAPYAGALADLDAWIAAEPTRAEARFRRGWLMRRASRWADAVADLEEAVRLDANLRAAVAPFLEEARAGLAAGTPTLSAERRAAIDRARARLQQGFSHLAGHRHGEARSAFDEGLRLAEEALADVPERERAAVLPRTLLQGSYYNRACLLARAMLGKTAPDEAPSPVSAEEAARLAGEAFACLDKAVGVGWRGVAEAEADGDLAPLRTDPRWAAWIARARGD